MRVFLTFAIITSIAAQRLVQEKWADFKIKHQKQYTSSEEEEVRYATFARNLAEIDEHNGKYERGEVTYSKAMNKFGDLTADEFLEHVNSKNNKKTLEGARTRHMISRRSTDDTVDWRTRGVVSEIEDEGDCDSSWSFSALGAIESQLAIKNGQLISLSEQNLIDCSGEYGNAGCSGGSAQNAFNYIKENGIMSESDYPYEGTNGTCRFDSSRSVTTISDYVAIGYWSETELQSAVETVGPVAAAVHATENLQFYYGGILFDDTCRTELTDLNHGVLVVGYGRENNQYDYWIVKNSWGVDWGENGFYKSIRNYGNNCGIATAASYPVL